jgi:hypothetical protein
MLRNRTELAPRACVFLSPDEPAFTAVAGAGGLEVLSLQFPRRTPHRTAAGTMAAGMMAG